MVNANEIPPPVWPRDVHCRILYVERVTIDHTWRHRLCNPFWRLYFNDEDGATIDHPGGSFRLPAGRIVLVPAWGEFESQCRRPVRHFYIHFDPVGLSGDWSRRVWDRPLAIPATPPRDQSVRALAEGIGTSPAWRLRAQALLLDCLAAALDQLSAASVASLEAQLMSDNPIAPALRHIDGFYHLPLTVPQLAELCRLSPDHFTRVFKTRTGQTPSQYLQHRRVAVAAERLIASDDDIARIATETGFANRYHFTRVFAKRMGVPPATYRRTGRV